MTDLPSSDVPHDAVDLSEPRRIHVVGVGGPGMNPIAAVLTAQGHEVSGSDMKDSSGLGRLRALGVDVTVGHDPSLIDDVDVVVRSTAIPDRNIELVAASDRGVPIARRAGVLHGISQLRRTIAVAGTHGKTTSSSMLSLAMVEADLFPSFIVGGDLNEIGSGSVWDTNGEWFVVEADESDGTFLHLDPEIAVVTNVERDHLEFHGSFDNLLDAFRRFLRGATRQRVVCCDDEWAAALGAEVGAVTFGTAEGADYRIVDVVHHHTSTSFAIEIDGEPTDSVELPIPGLYNVRNAVAAFVAGHLAGGEPQKLLNALGRFAGVARRFEFRGEADGITFVDDYAHLATEVAEAISAARSGDWRRVVAVFQPHRYSRTADVWEDFADAFVQADLTVLTDIYPAGEPVRPGITGMLLVDGVLGAHPWSEVAYLPTRDQLRRHLVMTLSPGDLCLTMGAGDLTSLARRADRRHRGCTWVTPPQPR